MKNKKAVLFFKSKVLIIAAVAFILTADGLPNIAHFAKHKNCNSHNEQNCSVCQIHLNISGTVSVERQYSFCESSANLFSIEISKKLCPVFFEYRSIGSRSPPRY